MNATSESNEKLLKTATKLSVAVACILLTLKLVAYIKTSSVSMLSSLVDSSLDALSSGINMYAVYLSLQPPDEQHRFGHGKAEAIAGLFQAAFIFGSGIFLLIESFSRLFSPHSVTDVDIGIYTMMVSLSATIMLIAFQRYVVRRTASVAIAGDMAHYTGDIIMNIGVIISLSIYKYTDFGYIDSVFSFGVAVYLICNAWQIGKSSIELLMDHELPEEIRQNIIKVAMSDERVKGIHAIKTRSAGTRCFIQLDLELDPFITLIKAHEISDCVEKKLKETYGNADILIHQDPTTEKPHVL